MPRGNQHGGREYDDLQNWRDITSHETPLLIWLRLDMKEAERVSVYVSFVHHK